MMKKERLKLLAGKKDCEVKSAMSKIKMQKDNLKVKKKFIGFTLIEFLVVLGIIAVLMGIAVVTINPVERFARARDNQRITHVEAIYGSIEQYAFFGDKDLPACFDDKSVGEFFDVKECEDDLIHSFLGEIPKDPKYGTSEETGYLIKKDSLGRVGVEAYHYEGNERIISGHWPQSCLDFDGSNDYVRVNSNSMFNTGSDGEFTYSAWTNSLNYESYQVVLARTNPCSNPGHFNIYTSSNKVGLTFYSNLEPGSCAHSSAGVVLENGEWHHVVWTKKWGQLGAKLYIDGVSVDISGDCSRKGTTYSDPIFIGARNRIPGVCVSDPSPNSFFTGYIDDVRIYNRILSATEVKQLYDGKNIMTGLIGYWSINEGDECTAYDLSGNENHGSLQPDCPINNPDWIRDCR